MWRTALLLMWAGTQACSGGRVRGSSGASSVVAPAGSENGNAPAAAGAGAGSGTSGAASGATTSAAGSDGNLWFGPYKDVTVNANWNTLEICTAVTGASTPVVRAHPAVHLVTWAFATGECGKESWGGMAPDALVAANVAAWAAAGTRYIVGTGGAAGVFTCGDDAAFAAFLDRYASAAFAGVDFDIEAGQNEADIRALVARVAAAEADPKYAKLRFSFTIATLGGNMGDNLGAQGASVVRAVQAAKLQHYTINLMAMDYGSASASVCALGAGGSCDMAQSAINAATALHVTYGVPYDHIELTPMVGGNDVLGETFTLEDAASLATYAHTASLAGLHYWSLDRDVDCPPGAASPTCNSYGKAGNFGFLRAFSAAP